ncbi:MAG TPA: hypothetical protein PLN80_06965, partial [Anaerolineaceae bacterium]|nr:hypothetical protein [Anaerolineaceae bacterium]
LGRSPFKAKTRVRIPVGALAARYYYRVVFFTCPERTIPIVAGWAKSELPRADPQEFHIAID